MFEHGFGLCVEGFETFCEGFDVVVFAFGEGFSCDVVAAGFERGVVGEVVDSA